MARMEMGSAWVSIHADTAPLYREYQTAKTRILSQDVKVRVRVDENINRDVDRAGSLLRSGLSTAASAAGKAISTALGAAFETVMELGSSAMNAIGKAGISAGAGLAGAAAAGAEMSVATGGLNIALGVLLPLILGVVAAVPMAVAGFLALAPALQIAAGGFAVAAAGAVAAVSSMATLKMAFSGISDALNAHSVSLKAYREELKKHAPVFERTIEKILNLKGIWEALTKVIESKVLPGFNKLLDAVTTLFVDKAGKMTGVISVHLKRMGAIFGDFFRQLAGYVGSDQFKNALGRIFYYVEGFVGHVKNALLAVIPAFMSIASSAAPLLKKLGGWIEDVATKLGKWVGGLAAIDEKTKKSKLDVFFADVGRTFSKLSTIAELVFKIIGDVVKLFFKPSKEASGNVFDGMISWLEKLHVWLNKPEAKQKIQEWWQKFQDIVAWIKNVFIPGVIAIAAEIKKWIDRFVGWANDIKAFKDKVLHYWGLIYRPIQIVLENVVAVYKWAWGKIIEGLSFWWKGFKKKFDDFMAIFKAIVSILWADIRQRWDAGWKFIDKVTSGWLTKIGKAIAGVKDTLVAVFRSIPAALAGPLNSIINFINGAIRKFNAIVPHDIPLIPGVGAPAASSGMGSRPGLNPGMGLFASGGHVRGPGTGTSDDIPAMLSNGEYVIRAAAVNKIGVSALDRLNNADRSVVDGDSDLRQCSHYANGGLVSGSRGYQWQMETLRKVFPGLGLISGYRPGSTTLSGNRSYHSRGMAVDVAPIRRVAEWIAANYGATTAELITPWRDLMLHNGRPHKYSQAVENQHGVGSAGNDHIHWAYTGRGGATGGAGGIFESIGALAKRTITSLLSPLSGLMNNVLPGKDPFSSTIRSLGSQSATQLINQAATFDRGGELFPGLTLAYNGTGKTETIRTAEQEAALGQGGATYVFQPGAITLDASKIKDIEDLARMVQGITMVSRSNRAGQKSRVGV